MVTSRSTIKNAAPPSCAVHKDDQVCSRTCSAARRVTSTGESVAAVSVSRRSQSANRHRCKNARNFRSSGLTSVTVAEVCSRDDSYSSPRSKRAPSAIVLHRVSAQPFQLSFLSRNATERTQRELVPVWIALGAGSFGQTYTAHSLHCCDNQF